MSLAGAVATTMNVEIAATQVDSQQPTVHASGGEKTTTVESDKKLIMAATLQAPTAEAAVVDGDVKATTATDQVRKSTLFLKNPSPLSPVKSHCDVEIKPHLVSNSLKSQEPTKEKANESPPASPSSDSVSSSSLSSASSLLSSSATPCVSPSATWEEVMLKRLAGGLVSIVERLGELGEIAVGAAKAGMAASAQSEKTKADASIQSAATRRICESASALREEASYFQMVSVTWWLDKDPVIEAFSIPQGSKISGLQKELVKESRYLKAQGSIFKANGDSKEPLFDWNAVELVNARQPRTLLMASFRIDPTLCSHIVIRRMGAFNPLHSLEHIVALERGDPVPPPPTHTSTPTAPVSHHSLPRFLTAAHFSSN